MTYDHITEDGEMYSIWEHPDLPGIEEIARNGQTKFECPNDLRGCDEKFSMRLDIDELDRDIETMHDHIQSEGGTIRCEECDEPLYGIYGDGDFGEDYQRTGWGTPEDIFGP